jgi:hypothetical protein
MKEWRIATHYSNVNNPEFFTSEGKIKPYGGAVGDGQDAVCFEHQRKLGELLRTVSPEISTHSLELFTSSQQIAEFCRDYLYSELRVKSRMISFGSTEDKKIML